MVDPDLKISAVETPSTSIDLGCSCVVQLPLEYLLNSSEYTVQLDTAQYVPGTFVNAGGKTESVKLNIEIDKQGMKNLQTFLFNRKQFYIKSRYLDLWINNEDWNGANVPMDVQYLVRKKSFSILDRKGPDDYMCSITIERLG
tara:strand:- start:7856 stop:8284 length:429 start_codon:yes stop_codon:yes gene_type:complete